MFRRILTAWAATILTACGGADKAAAPTPDPTPTPSDPVPAAARVYEGDGQTADAGAPVAVAPAVLVTDRLGKALGGVSVTFSIVAGGGHLAGGTATTATTGVARVGGWTLGTTGANRLRAMVAGLAPVEFAATAAPAATGSREWTVLVYLAADNSLAVAGVQDLDEMEAAGNNPRVSVVVQAEFSQTQLEQAGCRTAGCVNRPNYNTFRYEVNGALAHRDGPDGPAVDIGNRDMTSGAELHEFIEWGRRAYPARHTALVLWNHGGGYAGLIEDVTSSGSKLMSLDDLRGAITGAPLDLVDFDMCLMGGYETLAKLQDRSAFVTFSEEVVPGAGNPYTEILRGLYANPVIAPRDLAVLFADRFNASYAGSRASTTVSAFDMTGYGTFVQRLDQLGSHLRAALPANRSTITRAVRHAQKFEYPFLTDLGNLLDSLSVVPDAAVQADVSALRSQLTSPAFRLRSLARTGQQADARAVDRANGLHVLFPSGDEGDNLPDQGPASFKAYQALFPDRPWTAFIGEYLVGGTERAQLDQHEQRFETYLVWDDDAVAADADLDIWIIEPDGKIYIPYVGSVSPNGRFTNDSYDDDTYYEGWLTNRTVDLGKYRIYANLYQDPNNFRPQFNLAYRFGQKTDFAWLLNDPARMSMERSWLNDPQPSFEKIESGAYTDLRAVASWTASAQRLAGRRAAWAVDLPRIASASDAGPAPSPAQLAVVQRVLRERRSQQRRVAPAAAHHAPVKLPPLK